MQLNIMIDYGYFCPFCRVEDANFEKEGLEFERRKEVIM